MGRMLYVLCERVLSLFTNQNQFVGCYDTSMTGKGDFLYVMLFEGYDQNQSRVSGEVVSFMFEIIILERIKKEDD